MGGTEEVYQSNKCFYVCYERDICSLDALHVIILMIEESIVSFNNGLIFKCWGRNILGKQGQYYSP